MIKRTIEISQEPYHLAVELDQLRLHRRENANGAAPSIPCEDIGIVVVDHPAATYSHAALARLIEFGAAVVICGRNHLPSGLLLPLSDHTECVSRLHEQIRASRPLRKRLWKQVIRAKIRNQAANLRSGTPAHGRLLAMIKEVRSGDPTNIEAQAARIYWSEWLDADFPFQRDADAEEGVNTLLNYGYAIMRAAVGRAIVSAGLHPAIGLHHSNRSNAFCLADDLLEPLRPMVDRVVRDLVSVGKTQLNRETKAILLQMLTLTIRVGKAAGPLMVGLHRVAASLVECFQGLHTRLQLPQEVSIDG